MLKRNFLYISFLIWNASNAFCQIGGTATWTFLSLTNSARIAALGGKNVALNDGDLNLAFQNPALLSDSCHNNLVLNYVNEFAGLNYGYASYARHIKRIGNFATGIHYINYGTFTAADETGTITGQFKAAEYAMLLMYSYPIDSCWTVGITVKPVYSQLERYQALGAATDLGVSYTSRNQLFTAGLAVRNLGYQFKGYYATQHEPLPFEIIAGVSQKLSHAPFRFSFTAQQLQRLDLTYTNINDQSDNSTTTDNTQKKNKVEVATDKVLRHMILGVEFIPVKSFYVSLGYNYQRRKEMTIEDKTGMVGFSWGFGIRIKRFHLSYSRSAWHLAGGTDNFSISTNLSEFGLHRNTTTPIP